MVQVTLPIFENMYFTLNNHMMIVFLITIVQLAVAILGQVKNKAEVRKTSPL